MIKKLLCTLFLVLFLLFAFSENAFAQCSITTDTNTSSLSCGTPSFNISSCGGYLYIGNGTDAMTLNMNADLNLSCLGAIQLVVRNAAKIYFNSSNRLTLAAGSNIVIETGGNLEGTSCNASERIYIGNTIISTCNGQAGADSTFGQLVTNGGYSSITATIDKSSVCSSGSFTITAIASPADGATYKWYTTATGGTAFNDKYTTGDILATTTYYVEASYGSSYTTVRKAITATVNALPAVPVIGAVTQPTCAVSTGSVTLSGLPASWTLTKSGTTSPVISGTASSATISGLAEGTYYYSGSNGTCTSAASAAVTIKAQPATPAAPIVGAVTQPDCSKVTGSVIVSGLPEGNWTINSGAFSGSTTTATLTGLSAGTTYNFTVTNAAGCVSPASLNVAINPASVTATWNGTAWSTIPTIADKIVFNGKFTSASDLVGCSCQVNSGPVVIDSGHTLTLTNEVTVSGGTTLTFNDKASFVQINDNAINKGSITYIRALSASRATDYTYYSSPVAGQILRNVSPTTPSAFFYSFNAVADDWNYENPANVMTVGLGYIIRGPLSGLNESSFQGVPNNGSISIPIPEVETTNLIGNPYPSALNADVFLTKNNAILDGTIYFWTHNTEIGIGVSNPGTGVYAYSSDDYAGYNFTGGVATAPTVQGVTIAPNGLQKPSGNIAAGQGFLAIAKAAGSAVFDNSMRVGTAGGKIDNSQFFKMTNSAKTVNAIEKNRVWLNLTNDQGAFKQTLVGYVTNATNKYDNAFDGESVDGNQFVDFYSVNEDKNLTIQGRALPFDKNDQVPLGYSSTIKGIFSIAIDEVDGLLSSQDVFIEDKYTNTIKNLKGGAYSFSTEAGVFNDRFVLRYINTNKNLVTRSFEILNNTSVLVSKDKNELKIKSEVENIRQITVYDLLGRKVFDKKAIESNEFNISDTALNKQVVIVKVTLTTGQIISKKVIY